MSGSERPERPEQPEQPEQPERWGLLVAHPSRHERARATVAALARRLVEEAPGFSIWTLQSPTDGAVAHARRAPQGARFRIVPLLLAPGAHFHGDVAELARQVRQVAPTLDVYVVPSLLERDAFLTWLLRSLSM